MAPLARCRLAAALLLSAVSGSFEARATDLDEMGRLLTPAYTAMSLAEVCSAAPGWQERQPRGLRGVAIHYAEHVKDEMIEGLTHDEAVAVLRFAAASARNEARQQLQRHVYAEDQGFEAARLAEWCAHIVRGYISEFIQQHERDHGSFMEQLAQAKRRNAIH
jgi:hypothetical protein